MGLIKCPVCEKEISPNAVSCPHCGEPINMQKTRTLTLKRKHNRVIASAAIYNVYLDGICIGSLENGGTFQCEISTESHTLYPVNTRSEAGAVTSEKSKTIRIPEGDCPISYEFKAESGFFSSTIFFA